MKGGTKKRDTSAKRARRATITGVTIPPLDIDSPEDGNGRMLEEEEFDPSQVPGSYGDVARIRERRIDAQIGLLAEKLSQHSPKGKKLDEKKGSDEKKLDEKKGSDEKKLDGKKGSDEKKLDEKKGSDELEESFADFEKSYHELMTSSSSSAVPSGSTTLVSTSVPSRNAFQELSMSPSVTNLATMTSSRAKEIEVALRHRRQQQHCIFTRSGSELDLRGNRHSAPVPGSRGSTIDCPSNKSRVAWFLEQQAQNHHSDHHSDHSSSSTTINEKDPKQFSSKIRDLEAKLQAASGLNCFKEPIDVQQEKNMLLAQKKIISTKGSSMVISAATNLEKILDTRFQEKKLKEKATEYRKKTHDIKVVGKMTTETDWNKKRWEERQLKAEGEYMTLHDRPVRLFLPSKNITKYQKYQDIKYQDIKSYQKLNPNFLSYSTRSFKHYCYTQSQLDLLSSQSYFTNHFQILDENNNHCDTESKHNFIDLFIDTILYLFLLAFPALFITSSFSWGLPMNSDES